MAWKGGKVAPNVQRHRSVVLKLAFFVVAALAGFGLAEIGSRTVWKVMYNQWLTRELHGFDHVDRGRSLVVPIANTRKTVEQLRKEFSSYGKVIALDHLEELVREQELPDTAVIYSINSHGFRGPELSIPKPDGVYRILAIGDSCTWGPLLDSYSYPRIVERGLASWVHSRYDRDLEVVNGGVLGYNFERALKRIDEYLAVEPDLVTIYLGWNRTIGRADPRKHLGLYRKLATYRFFYHAVVNRSGTGLSKDFYERTYYDKNDPTLAAYTRYDFHYDIEDLSNLVNAIRARGASVVLITLAGIFDSRVEPDDRALRVAYPTATTNNLYAYAILTRLFNSELRRFAEARELPLIDFEHFAFEHFDPRSVFFLDSVHPSLKGYEAMGRFLAAELAALDKM